MKQELKKRPPSKATGKTTASKPAVSIPQTVDEYLAPLPAASRKALEQLRKAILESAPAAEEVISYRVPTYKQNGPLVCFAAFPNHLSFFTTSHALMKEFAKELQPYATSGVTIRFTADKPLPAALVKKIVKARVRENMESVKPKAKR